MLASPSGIPAFKFQLRRDTIDWRRISAIDVERVARELDLATLQENINSITFCNLDAEKCPYCQQPVDPVFLKILKLAQLTIEYLLHSQEYLSMNLALQEEQHQAALADLGRIKHDLETQAEELKNVKEEGRRRKKMIATLQLLLQAGANNYHKVSSRIKQKMEFFLTFPGTQCGFHSVACKINTDNPLLFFYLVWLMALMGLYMYISSFFKKRGFVEIRKEAWNEKLHFKYYRFII